MCLLNKVKKNTCTLILEHYLHVLLESSIKPSAGLFCMAYQVFGQSSPLYMATAGWYFHKKSYVTYMRTLGRF